MGPRCLKMANHARFRKARRSGDTSKASASSAIRPNGRELRACDYGDPTIRKRLFVIMRSDRKPIIWPERTHGNPKDARDADLIAASTLKPWRTAAEIIDFALPCPSIFDSASTIKDKLGIRAVRPLADNTMARVAKGTMRYVVNAAKPFLVSIGERGGGRRESNPSRKASRAHPARPGPTPHPIDVGRHLRMGKATMLPSSRNSTVARPAIGSTNPLQR